jgi:hypothetical protein
MASIPEDNLRKEPDRMIPIAHRDPSRASKYLLPHPDRVSHRVLFEKE